MRDTPRATGFLHRFFDYNGQETDFKTWQRLRDDVGADWAQDNHQRTGVFVSTCFRGDDYDGEVVLWETRVTRLPDDGFVAGRYSSHDEAVRGHAAIVENENVAAVSVPTPPTEAQPKENDEEPPGHVLARSVRHMIEDGFPDGSPAGDDWFRIMQRALRDYEAARGEVGP